MYLGPKEVIDRINLVQQAWTRLRPAKPFAGLTLEQYREAVKPNHDIRVELAEAEARVQDLKMRRGALDKEALGLLRSVIHGVKADREEGDDGELYAAMGFVRSSDRSSGLTRRRVNGKARAEEETP